MAERQTSTALGSPRYHIPRRKHWLGSPRVCFHGGDRGKLPRVYRTRYTLVFFFFYKLPANNLQFSAALKISPAPASAIVSISLPFSCRFIRSAAIPSYCQLWPISIRRIFPPVFSFFFSPLRSHPARFFLVKKYTLGHDCLTLSRYNFVR